MCAVSVASGHTHVARVDRCIWESSSSTNDTKSTGNPNSALAKERDGGSGAHSGIHGHCRGELRPGDSWRALRSARSLTAAAAVLASGLTAPIRSPRRHHEGAHGTRRRSCY